MCAAVCWLTCYQTEFYSFLSLSPPDLESTADGAGAVEGNQLPRGRGAARALVLLRTLSTAPFHTTSDTLLSPSPRHTVICLI